MHIHALTSFLQKAALDVAPGIFQIFGIGFAAGTKFFQFISCLLFLLFELSDSGSSFLMLFFRICTHGYHVFFQSFQCLQVNGAVFKFLHIPKGLVGGDVLFLPAL